MTLKYVSGGMLGDFIKQLSIVHEKWVETGERGIVYMTDKLGDSFRHGIENTYADIRDIVCGLEYIEDFKIHHDEEYDVDLTEWRYAQAPFFVDRVMECYGVPWGRHPWIHNIPTSPEWGKRIVINTTAYRFPDSFDWDRVFRWYEHDAEFWFVGNSEHDYQDFVNRTNRPISFHQPATFLEMCTIINSCFLFVGSMSTPMCIAYSLHKRCVVGCHHLETLFMRLNKHNKYIRYDLPTIPEITLDIDNVVSMSY